MWSGMGHPRHDDEAEGLLRLMSEHQMELLLPPRGCYFRWTGRTSYNRIGLRHTMGSAKEEFLRRKRRPRPPVVTKVMTEVEDSKPPERRQCPWRTLNHTDPGDRPVQLQREQCFVKCVPREASHPRKSINRHCTSHVRTRVDFLASSECTRGRCYCVEAATAGFWGRRYSPNAPMQRFCQMRSCPGNIQPSAVQYTALDPWPAS